MEAPSDWLAAFAAHLPSASALDELPRSALEQKLRALYESGRAAWPGVELPLVQFAAHLGKHGPKAGGLEAALLELRVPELYLTGACACGIPAALVAFDERFLSQLPAFLSRLKPSPTFLDEMRQVLREQLLVAGPGRAPRIAEYSGRGALVGWLRVTALRIAMRARRGKAEQLAAPGDNDLPIDAFPDGANPELDYLKERYRQEFQTAFQGALHKLTIEQRNLLRLHFIDGLNIEKIGTLMHVHRATVARWIAQAREAILDHVQRDLKERLRLGESEFESLVNLVRSQLHVSILRFLVEPPASGS